jgi:hypothetical protein
LVQIFKKHRLPGYIRRLTDEYIHRLTDECIGRIFVGYLYLHRFR